MKETELNRSFSQDIYLLDDFDGRREKDTIESYLKCIQLSICENDNRFKYNEERNVEWVFSPKYR
jgi:hypothetical protein